MSRDNVTALPGKPANPIRQDQPDFSPAGFGRRLVAGLDALEIPESDRAAKVAEAAGVTIRTARRYLKGASQPRGIFRQKLLAEGLGLNCSWLIFGRMPFTEAEYQARREDERQFIEAFRKNPPWRQRLIERTLARMANGSRRVERLMDMQESGQLSPDDFLRLAGR